MATDYAGMEREFISSLEADTGHDLAGWMMLIDRQNLSHRNDIIDWLRTQRFTFSWASWLERIHHNGGRPIYNAPLTASPAKPEAPVHPPPVTARAPVAPPVTIPTPPAPAPSPLRPPLAPPAANENGASVSDLLARGKAYRMLAEHLLREVRRAIPDATVSARGSYISLAHPAEFAALLVSPKELRLGVQIGEPAPAELTRGRLPGTDAAISHVITLTDARQITPALVEAVRRADKTVNGG